MKKSFLLAAFLSCSSAFPQAVVPGEFTDPSNLKKQVAEEKGYKTPEKLKFPYVSTYWVKPTLVDGESAAISFFVTDWDSSKVRFLDDTFRFTVHLNLKCPSGAEKLFTLKDVKSGDGTFKLGKLPVGEYAVGVWAVDAAGRESHRSWHEFRVVKTTHLDVPADKTFTPTAADFAAYGIRNDGALGRTALVEIGELPAKHNDKDVEAACAKAFDAFVAAGKLPPAGKTPGYVVLVPAQNGRVLFRSYQRARVLFDDGYDTNAVEQAAVKTAEGLQKLIGDKASAGFRKLVLPKGTYRVSAFRKIALPDDFTLDLNGATLKENAFTGCHSVIVDLTSAVDAHLVNGTLEGDYYEHDYKNSPNSSEWPQGFTISAASKYSSVENVHVKNITGYGAGNGLGKDKRGGYQYFYEGTGKYGPGGLDPKTGLVDTNEAERATSGFLPLAKVKPHKWVQVSKYLGYQGRTTRAWGMVACWYDADKKFLQSETLFQYRAVPVPEKASFLRVSVEVGSVDEANKAGLVMTHFRIPVNCVVKNCKFERCRAVGYAASQMKDMLFEGNEFTCSGEALAKCAFDAEDGWDQMQDVYFKGNWFHDNPVNNSILTCAGHNFILEKNRGGIHFWGRTHSPCVRDNDVTDATYMCDSRLRSGYGRFENNRYAKGVNIRGTASDSWDYVLANLDFTDSAKTFTVNCGPSGRLVGCAFADRAVLLSNASGCTLKNCKGEFLPAGNWFGVVAENCSFANLYQKNRRVKCTFKNVTFHNLKGGEQLFEECTFENCTFTCLTEANARFKRCHFVRCTSEGGWWSKPSTIGFEDCKFELDKNFLRLPLYTIGKVGFFGCKIKGKGALMEIYDYRPQPTDDQVGKLAIKNCTFGPGLNQAIVGTGHKPGASKKKLKIQAKDNKFMEPNGEAVKDSTVLPEWSLD